MLTISFNIKDLLRNCLGYAFLYRYTLEFSNNRYHITASQVAKLLMVSKLGSNGQIRVPQNHTCLQKSIDVVGSTGLSQVC